METFKKDFINIYHTEHGVLLFMGLNFLMSLGLLIFSIVSINSNSIGFKIGYGDIGGYRDGSWVDMLAFPILAIIFGILHNLLALRIFHKRGSGMAKFFLLTTTALIVSTLLVLIRLLGEG